MQNNNKDLHAASGRFFALAIYLWKHCGSNRNAFTAVIILFHKRRGAFVTSTTLFLYRPTLALRSECLEHCRHADASLDMIA